MTKMRALVLLLLVVAVCLVVALPVAVLVDLFPAWVGLLVLVGVLVPGLLLSLLAPRWLVGNRRAEFAARLQQRQAIITWACAVAAIGGLPLTAFGNGIEEVVGLVIAAAGGCAAFWAVLRAVPEKADRNTQSPSAG